VASGKIEKSHNGADRCRPLNRENWPCRERTGRTLEHSVTTKPLERTIVALTIRSDSFSIITEVHVGWCPPGTSNPVDLPPVDRSVRFRHTSAKPVYTRIVRSCGRVRQPAGVSSPDEPHQTTSERTIPRLEGSEATGAGASWDSSSCPARREPAPEASQT
jgi:hypothetical protein